MDTESITVALCVAGTRAEYEGRPDEARSLYQQAWDATQDDYDACIAAHYMARFGQSPEEVHEWNLRALAHAQSVVDERVAAFYPSLYVNLGRSFETLGDEAQARHYYRLAADLGLVHEDDPRPDQDKGRARP